MSALGPGLVRNKLLGMYKVKLKVNARPRSLTTRLKQNFNYKFNHNCKAWWNSFPSLPISNFNKKPAFLEKVQRPAKID